MKSLIVIFCIFVTGAYASPLDQYLTGAGGRIVGGVETTPFQYPFQCSIHVRVSGVFKHNCGATILAETWILTAAHCVDTETTYQVWCGKWDLIADEPGEQKINAKRLVIHTNFTTNLKPYNVPWDIALIELESPLVFTDTVQPTQLPPPNYDPHIISDSTLIGWGYYIDLGITGVKADRLRHVNVTLIPVNQCVGFVGPIYAELEHIVCTGPILGGKGSCNSDSGGAMVQRNGSTLYQTGIASWILHPCGMITSGYLKTNVFRDWISEHQVSTV